MTPIFILVGAASKFLNLRLRKRRALLEVQKDLMGSDRTRSTHPDKVEIKKSEFR